MKNSQKTENCSQKFHNIALFQDLSPREAEIIKGGLWTEPSAYWWATGKTVTPTFSTVA